MHPQRIRIKPIFLSFVAASALIGISLRAFGGDVSKSTQPKQASFQVRNEFKVQVPKGAKIVRVWFSVPQEDAVSVIREFSVAADFPVHYYRDDWGNRVGYAELNAPAEGPITIREAFGLTRTETRIRWVPASGFLEKFFDDVPVEASRGLERNLGRKLGRDHQCKSHLHWSGRRGFQRLSRLPA